MKNTFGSNLTVTIIGESHGPVVGCVIDGISPGIKVDEGYIAARMAERQARGDISTPRHEADIPEILSGVKDGYTEGTPILITVKNENTNSASYLGYEFTPRPGHADLTAEYKYHGYQDKRGGGHFSGRVTAALVAAGALIRSALESKGIFIGTHIKELHGVADRSFEVISDDIELLKSAELPVLDGRKAEMMKKKILEAKDSSDSVGGILETVVTGVPSGVGEPWFDTVEGVLAHILFSVPGIKGVEFGDGFAVADMLGSEVNDGYTIDNGSIVTRKNSSGGILGGITLGSDILFRCAVKPTPSIGKTQETVDTQKMECCDISVKGRHDPCIIHRARAVVDSVTAIAIGDMLITRFGTDYLGKD